VSAEQTQAPAVVVPLRPVAQPEPERALTDMGNAARFARAAEGAVRYSPSSGWLTWDSARWRRDETGEVERLARDVVRAIYREAADEADSGKRRDIARWAATSESEPRLRALLSLAKSELGIATTADVFDREPMLLNTASGIVDLRTGEILEHDPAKGMSKLAPAFYSRSATCARWLTFLDEIMAHDLGMVEFLQRAIGYSVTGDTGEQVVFLLWGTGANGKSVFLETLRRVLGDYAVNASADTFLTKPAGAIPNDVARLHGARLVTAIETGDGARLAESLVKQITGGDTLTARFLHREYFEFRPAFKVFLATNHKPRITGSDYAIWRRIRLIPFEVTIPPERRDPHLADKLAAESKGILAWAVEGCLAWQQRGLDPPERVLAATAGYQAEQDSLAGFISDRCAEGNGLRAYNLYGAYRRWAEDGGFHPMNATTFSMRLQAKGYTTGRDHGGRYFTGLSLLAGDEA